VTRDIKSRSGKSYKHGYVRMVAEFTTLDGLYRSLRTHPMVAVAGRAGPKSLRDVLFFAGALAKLLLDAMRDGAEIHIRWPDRRIEIVDMDLAFGGGPAETGKDRDLLG